MARSMENAFGTAFAALAFAVCFGAVGAGAAWLMGSTLIEGYSARDWIRVKADVVTYGGGNIAYKYRVGDREYTGDKLGPGPLSGGEVDDELDARITAAQADQKPITVFVDPDDPRRSLADPSIPWQLVLFMTPFALAFGGVGLGALVAAGKLLFGRGKAESKGKVQVAGSGAGFLWMFGFFWNALAIPISLLIVPDAIRDGEWAALLVLIFPLVGLLVIWAAIATTWSGIKRGRVEFHLQDPDARVGSVVSGFVKGKRMKAGDAFRVTLACITKGDDGSAALVHWSQEKNLRVAQGPQGERLAFSFDTPDRLPAAAGPRGEKTDWRVELFAQGESKAASTFYFEMFPPVGAAMVDVDDEDAGMAEADLDDQPVPAGIPQGMQGIAAFVGQERLEERINAMSTTDRAQLHARFEQLTPDQKQALEKLGKYAHYGPLVKKLVITVIVLFVLVQVAGVVSVILFSS